MSVSFILSILNANALIYSKGMLPDFMSFERLHTRLFYYINLFILGIFITACAISAPVQEMSNARQSIRAAKEANAEKLAETLLSEAKKRLGSATRELDAGEYERARTLAIEATHLALKARQLAISKKAN